MSWCYHTYKYDKMWTFPCKNEKYHVIYNVFGYLSNLKKIQPCSGQCSNIERGVHHLTLIMWYDSRNINIIYKNLSHIFTWYQTYICIYQHTYIPHTLISVILFFSNYMYNKFLHVLLNSNPSWWANNIIVYNGRRCLIIITTKYLMNKCWALMPTSLSGANYIRKKNEDLDQEDPYKIPSKAMPYYSCPAFFCGSSLNTYWVIVLTIYSGTNFVANEHKDIRVILRQSGLLDNLIEITSWSFTNHVLNAGENIADVNMADMQCHMK